MKKQNQITAMDSRKVIAIYVLFTSTIIIMGLGIYFSIISILDNVMIKVINTQVHGIVLGVLVFYLGLKYFMSVIKLKTEVYKDTSKFSWSNFKKEKKVKL